MKKKKPYVSVGNNIIWFTGKLFRLAPGALATYLISIPLAVAMSYAEIYLPALVVREATVAREMGQAALSIGLVLGLMLVGQVLGEWNKVFSSSCVESYTDALMSMVNQKAQKLFYQKYEQKSTRNLQERAAMSTQMWDNVRPITDIFTHLTELIKSILCYLLFGTMVSMVSPWLLPILTVSPLVNWLCVRAYNHYEYRNREKNKDTSGKVEYLIGQAEDFRAGKDIRIYGMTEWFLGLFRSLDQELAAWDRKLGFRRFLSRIADLAVILLRDGAAYLLLISMTLRGEIAVEQFVLYFAAISSFATWVGNIIDRWNKLHATSLKLCDLREFMDLESWQGEGEICIREHLVKAPEIVFDHVSFRYEGAEADTLKDLCFTIRAGEKIALVGLNGAGKTTLVKLLCGLYLPTSGQIRVNGVPVQKFALQDYYELFSPVFQEVRTGFFSLAQSVSGKVDDRFDSARVEACLRNAGLSEKLDQLPEGIYTRLDKQLYDDGTELSGGEAQKLMLARALYKDAPMLVLDEPTAALDPIAESKIYETYQQMTNGKTALYISHRLASTRFCDRILYLENGVIAEEGTCEELMQLGGKYSALYEMQSCWYREDYQKGGEEA